MTEIQSALLVFVLLLGGTGLGILLRPLLPEEHRRFGFIAPRNALEHMNVAPPQALS
jgi:hypothetical protein